MLTIFPQFPILSSSVVTFLIAVTIYLICLKEERLYLWLQKCQATVRSSDSGPVLKENTMAARSCGGGLILFTEDRKQRGHVLVTLLFTL